jgi:hypothetical protein
MPSHAKWICDVRGLSGVMFATQCEVDDKKDVNQKEAADGRCYAVARLGPWLRSYGALVNWVGLLRSFRSAEAWRLHLLPVAHLAFRINATLRRASRYIFIQPTQLHTAS